MWLLNNDELKPDVSREQYSHDTVGDATAIQPDSVRWDPNWIGHPRTSETSHQMNTLQSTK